MTKDYRSLEEGIISLFEVFILLKELLLELEKFLTKVILQEHKIKNKTTKILLLNFITTPNV